jgi:hypothetical protein
MGIISFEDFAVCAEAMSGALQPQVHKPIPPLFDSDLRVLYDGLCSYSEMMEEALPGYIEKYATAEAHRKWIFMPADEKSDLAMSLLKKAQLSREQLIELFTHLFVQAEILGQEAGPMSDPEVIGGVVDSYRAAGVL